MRVLLLIALLFCIPQNFNQSYSQNTCACTEISNAKEQISKQTLVIKELVNRDLDSAKVLILYRLLGNEKVYTVKAMIE